MATTISWSLIEAECDGFRAGFVATFRKYEGLPTDKKDKYGRAEKVTAKTFARYMGIAETTFRRWVKMSAGAAPISEPRSKGALKRDVTRAIRNEPDAVVNAIMETPEPTRDKIFHELKLRREGIDRSPAGRKAAEAHTHDRLEPTHRVLHKMASGAIGWADTINEVVDEIEQAIEDGIDVTPELPAMEVATDRLALAIERAKMVSEARR